MTVPLNKQVHYSKRIYYVIFGQVVVKKCSGKKKFLYKSKQNVNLLEYYPN